jgi:hypothetical protein
MANNPANDVTTGLGVAAKIAVPGNVQYQSAYSTVPGYNVVILSKSGTVYPQTFQLVPVLEDVAGNVQSAVQTVEYVSYSAGVATVSSSGLISAVAEGGSVVEVSYPTFGNTEGTIYSPSNPMNGLPKEKIYAEVNVTVVS